MVGTGRFELPTLAPEVEPICGRERSRGPRHARFSRDGVEERESAGEILSVAEGSRGFEIIGRDGQI